MTAAWAALAWGAGLALCLAMPAAAAPPKPRVASVTVCGDLYALMLADRSQIAAVSPEADGPLAYYPDRAKGLARNRGDLEGLLAAHADVVLLEDGGKPQLARALQQLGVKTIILPTSVEFLRSRADRPDRRRCPGPACARRGGGGRHDGSRPQIGGGTPAGEPSSPSRFISVPMAAAAPRALS